MGRYYDGDIEGKFWFGVQSSDDAEFFGAKEREPMFVEYGVEDIAEVDKGLDMCILNLGANKERLDKFFDSCEHGYNDEMLIKYYKDKVKLTIDEDFVRKMLIWYARLDLGEKIKKCMVEKGFCEFRAEL
jgi:phage terminase large subunit